MLVKHVLRTDQEQMGWSIEEPDDHTVNLVFRGILRATFTSSVTVELLRQAADDLFLILSPSGSG